ncbi:MAG: hypothetical protein ACLFQA_02815 [Bacteroidales bacterium]
MAKGLFRNLISASNELDVNRIKIPLWQEMLLKMPEEIASNPDLIVRKRSDHKS